MLYSLADARVNVAVEREHFRVTRVKNNYDRDRRARERAQQRAGLHDFATQAKTLYSGSPAAQSEDIAAQIAYGKKLSEELDAYEGELNLDNITRPQPLHPDIATEINTASGGLTPEDIRAAYDSLPMDWVEQRKLDWIKAFKRDDLAERGMARPKGQSTKE
jgi:hypothetical protein